MLPIYLFLAALLVAPSVAQGQEAEPERGTTQAEPAAPAPARIAMPRGSRPQGDNPRIGTAVPRAIRPGIGRGLSEPAPRAAEAPRPAPAETAARTASAQEQSAPEPERRAVPRGSRPQGDNPRIGTAVPRSSAPPRSGGGITTDRGRTVVVPNRSRTVIVRPPSIYGYYYPRGYYPYGYAYTPYGYGAFGLGYFYYNPYRWYPGYAPGFSTYGYYDGYRQPFSSFDIGEIRLDVSPRHAQVYVDGYYAGVVDDYDGVFQGLKLESGAYRIEITAPGYENLGFDVRISPGQKIRYEGNLRRVP
jgi:hypothetical protein